MTTCLYCHNKHSKKELEAKDAEIAELKDTITSLRVQLAVIGEYVKDKVSFAIVESEK